MDDEMRLHLLGDHGDMDPRALHQALGALLALLGGPEGSRSGHPPLVVSGLSDGSMEVALRPRDSNLVATQNMERVWKGLGLLAAAPGAPADWDRAMLGRLISLGDVKELVGVEGATLSWAGQDAVRIDGPVAVHARESLRERRTSIGSVRGRLDRWNYRGHHHEVGLIDEATGKAIRVTVPDELSGQVIAALQRPVLAWGLIGRDVRGDKVSLTLEGFELVEASEHVPAGDMVGLLGDWTDGESSVEWVRAQRAE